MENKEITKEEVIELNEQIKNRLNEIGLTEFHFTDFCGNHDWCDEDIDLNMVIHEDYDEDYDENYKYDFRYWIATPPIGYEDICIDLRAIKLVGDTIQYWLEYYTETDNGSFNEEVYSIEFEDLLNMDSHEDYKSIHSLLGTIVYSLEDDDNYGLIEINKEHFG